MLGLKAYATTTAWASGTGLGGDGQLLDNELGRILADPSLGFSHFQLLSAGGGCASLGCKYGIRGWTGIKQEEKRRDLLQRQFRVGGENPAPT